MHISALALSFGLLATSAYAGGGSFSLEAEPGKFNAKPMGAASATLGFSESMRLNTFAGTSAWPAAAYIGVHEGADRNNSVHVLAIRNHEADDYLVVGYRLVVGGKEVKVAALENVPISATVAVSLSFKAGTATIRVNEGNPIAVLTPFHVVTPYVSVSSGKAQFRGVP